MTGRDVKIQTYSWLLTLWLWLNLAVWRVDYVVCRVEPWAKPSYTGGYRGWVRAAEFRAAKRLGRKPPRTRPIQWILYLLIVITWNMALVTTFSTWVGRIVGPAVASIFVSSALNRREMYKHLTVATNDSA